MAGPATQMLSEAHDFRNIAGGLRRMVGIVAEVCPDTDFVVGDHRSKDPVGAEAIARLIWQCEEHARSMELYGPMGMLHVSDDEGAGT